jgi:hypothetical protein
MSSNYTKVAPNIKKSLISGTSFSQGSFPKSNLNNNSGFRFSDFTSNIGSSNTCFPLNHNFQTALVGDYSSSNLMIPSDEFNVIKVDISTQNTIQNTRLDVFYGHNQSLDNSSIRYSTIIQSGSNFYRNYPVENKFFSISLKNLDDSAEGSSEVKGSVTLSKYTQYNAPVQMSDQIDRFTMGTLERQANDFNFDIINGRISDVKKVERIGEMPSNYGNPEQIVWGIDAFNNFALSEDFRPLVLRSEGVSPNNGNKQVIIEGIATGDIFVTELVTLAPGTSNAFTISEYKFVGNMYFQDGGENEADNLVAADRDTGTIYNYIDGSSTTSTSLLYTCPSETSAIIHDINLNGRTNLVNGSYFNLSKVNYSSNSRTNIYQNRTIDDSLNTVIPLNYKLEAGDCLIGSMLGGTTSNTESQGDTTIFSRLNIYEFSNSDSKVI